MEHEDLTSRTEDFSHENFWKMLIELTHMVDTCDFAKENRDSTKKTGKNKVMGWYHLDIQRLIVFCQFPC